ncbi:MAG TPA: pilus assembly protein N-terminal domain-containing protein [Gemmatimonadales bacterium]
MSLRHRVILAALLVGVMLPPALAAQTVLQRPAQALSLPRGTSLLLTNPSGVGRVTTGDPAIAEILVVSPTELLINGRGLGSTTMIIWEPGNVNPRVYALEVTIDTPALERYLRQALPGETITVNASGNSVTLSGNVQDPFAVDRALEIARATGVASVVNNLISPPAVQIMLKVRFAEINRSNLKDWASALQALNPQELDSDGDWFGQTISDGLIRILLTNPNANAQALINASFTKGILRSLAEPNLLTLPGKEASFLAGGEFPYPTVQGATAGGVGQQAITITFREFGVRLKFTPNLTQSGAIRLKVAPEVSTLDFANGLTISGFEIPSILIRKAETEVELRPGQYLALAGLIDNGTIENVSKIPLLGDIPILGHLFKSTQYRARQTELLVLVTPVLVQASEVAQPLPTGEPITWKWPGWMRRELQSQPQRWGTPPGPATQRP